MTVIVAGPDSVRAISPETALRTVISRLSLARTTDEQRDITDEEGPEVVDRYLGGRRIGLVSAGFSDLSREFDAYA